MEIDIVSGLRESANAAVKVPDGTDLISRYRKVRALTEKLCEPLEPEDYVVQTMMDVSPTKWHLAHVTWFYETFILRKFDPDYRLLNDQYPYLFNSYYTQAGERHCRDQRGYLSRPTVREVYEYREYVDRNMIRMLERMSDSELKEVFPVFEVGLNHEQQHQELLLTDVKHVLSVNPLRPIYRERENVAPNVSGSVPMRWHAIEEGVYEVGHAGSSFSYDNEEPRHRVYLQPCEIAGRLVTNAEYLEFMEDGGYQRPELWLSAGWAWIEANGWTEPFYWEKGDTPREVFTLAGRQLLNPDEPVCHVRYFEADAYARWAGYRLPTEQKWEVVAAEVPIEGNFVQDGELHPMPAKGGVDHHPEQMYGDVWEWTRSQYSPYPGFKPLEGALGEYNGKFMCNQFVLRGGSCATSADHIRPTYRNFFAPESCWQFTGIRLARDV